MEIKKMDVLTVNDVCKRLGISEATFIDEVQKNNLPAEKNKAGAWEIDSKKLDLWMEGGKEIPEETKQTEAPIGKKSNSKKSK
jgi:hypothetical protein